MLSACSDMLPTCTLPDFANHPLSLLVREITLLTRLPILTPRLLLTTRRRWLRLWISPFREDAQDAEFRLRAPKGERARPADRQAPVRIVRV